VFCSEPLAMSLRDLERSLINRSSSQFIQRDDFNCRTFLVRREGLLNTDSRTAE